MAKATRKPAPKPRPKPPRDRPTAQVKHEGTLSPTGMDQNPLR
jgi:hypothetical protein